MTHEHPDALLEGYIRNFETLTKAFADDVDDVDQEGDDDNDH